MCVYIAIAMVLFVLNISDSARGFKVIQKKWILSVIALFLALFAGLRYDVGFDYNSYSEIFSRNSDITVNEPIFNAISTYVKENRIDPKFAISALAFLSIYFAWKYISKYSINIFFSVLVFFCFGQYYFNTFNAIRQCVVIYWFWASIGLIINRKIIKYLIGIFIMYYTFHTTALYLVVLYFACRFDLSRKAKLALLCVSPFLTAILAQISMITQYAIYMEFEYSTQMTVLQILVLVVGLFYVVYPVTFRDDRMARLFNMLNYVNTYVLMLLFFSQGTPLVMVLTRLSYYTSPIYIVLIPQSVNNLRNANNKVVVISLVSIFLMLMLYVSLCLNGVQNNLIPYKTVFS
jgi:hypothetical protein